jgi:hypothetical protein
MNKLLALVRKSRTARKEAAQGRLAAAQQELARAVAASTTAVAEIDEANDWREAFLRRNGVGLNKDWRHTMLPSINALIFQRRGATVKALERVEAQRRVVVECREALTRCERALMRNEELQGIVDLEAKDRERLAEQSQDDDLAISHGRSAGAAAWS